MLMMVMMMVVIMGLVIIFFISVTPDNKFEEIKIFKAILFLGCLFSLEIYFVFQ